MIVGTVSEAAQVLAPFFAEAEGERLAVLHLARDNRLLALTLERPGGHDAVDLPIPDILRKAIAVGADAILLAHNHPSGDAAPSIADEAATRALAAAAAGVEIRLHDHLIFAGADCRSFRSLGLL
jgi:DNA repair protein RadC